MEAASGLFTELQAGTYCFMDAAYMMLEAEDGQPAVPFEKAPFVLTTVMSVARWLQSNPKSTVSTHKLVRLCAATTVKRGIERDGY